MKVAKIYIRADTGNQDLMQQHEKAKELLKESKFRFNFRTPRRRLNP
ncbi:hypothetical protein [Neisseria arctica]|nr:hypothetical protein [Neisseria arctica]UOO85699.1 hypothetical protein LVJ86_05515 [Neisseria arctica]